MWGRGPLAGLVPSGCVLFAPGVSRVPSPRLARAGSMCAGVLPPARADFISCASQGSSWTFLHLNTWRKASLVTGVLRDTSLSEVYWWWHLFILLLQKYVKIYFWRAFFKILSSFWHFRGKFGKLYNKFGLKSNKKEFIILKKALQKYIYTYF